MDTNLDLAEIHRGLCQQSLYYFVWQAYDVLHPSSANPFVENWHIEAICHALEEVASGKCPKLIITVPPRHLKTICTSVAFPAWLLGRNPTTKILVTSYGGDLAAQHSLDTKTVMQSTQYRQIFPHVRLKIERQLELVTTQQGMRKGVSLGGQITGFGADYLIIDDPMKPDDASSPLERQRVQDHYAGTLYSRLNDQRNPRIIIIAQRLHEDDLPGYLLELGGFKHLNLPATADRDEAIPIGGGKMHVRRKGDLLFPQLQPWDALEKIRHNQGASIFAAQYQQNPVPPGGNRIRWEWWRFYDQPFRREDYQYLAQSWDTAHSEEPKSSYSVCTTWGYRAPYWYLLDVYRARHAYHELLKIALRLHRQWQPDRILIEKAASGHSLISDLRNTHKLRAEVRPWPVTADKETRFEAQMAKIESGSFSLPKEASWLEEFKREFLAFPRGRYDDQVDSVTQFLEWVGAHRGGAAIISRRNYNPPCISSRRYGRLVDYSRPID